MMNWDNYEKKKWMAEQVNKTVQKDVFFDIDEIMNLDDNTSDKVVGVMLQWACQSQYDTTIYMGRDYLTRFPKDWITEKIKHTAPSYIDITDYWDYQRLLELSKIISDELLRWSVLLGKDADDPEIADAADEYFNILIEVKICKEKRNGYAL